MIYLKIQKDEELHVIQIQRKKPYTVVVGVVLLIVLGVVSFGKLKVDLLPGIELPYAVVMTKYQGASPEEVEANRESLP